MCAECLKEYVQNVTDGQVWIVEEEVKSFDDVVENNRFQKINCPIDGCGKSVEWGVVASIFSNDEFNVLMENAALKAGLITNEEDESRQAVSLMGKSMRPTLLPGKCHTEGCKNMDLCKLRKCPRTCSLFICKAHQKDFFTLVKGLPAEKKCITELISTYRQMSYLQHSHQPKRSHGTC